MGETPVLGTLSREISRSKAVSGGLYEGDRVAWAQVEASSEPVLIHSRCNILLLAGISAELCSSEFTLENENNNFLPFHSYQIGKLIFSVVRHSVYEATPKQVPFEAA